MRRTTMFKRLGLIAAMIGGAIIMALSSGVAWADKRIALVVGNSSYQTVPQLPNPARDAKAVGQMFKDAGFDSVEVLLDLGNLEFKRAIRKFEADADQADIAVVYYAGHGIEVNGNNFLIPVDARLSSDRDAEDEAIRLERMVLSADGAKKLRVIILDACRDNPFTVKMRRERRAALRAISSGLGKVEPTSTDTLIAYAAKAGSTADDGEGKHSPFTTALLKNLTVPGLDIRLAFGRVRDEVMKLTGARQEPFVYGSLGGGNISLVPPPVVEKEPEAADVKGDFELVAKINSARAWEVFISTYKTGFYADLARAQLASLTSKTASDVARDVGNVTVAALPQDTPAPVNEPSSRERLEFDRLKDSTDQAALKRFIKRYPDSPLALQVQHRLEVLQSAAAEREEKQRAEREAARLAAEQARIEAERKKAELAAARKREEDERRAKAEEAAQQARAADAERKAAEAKRKAEEAQRKAEELAAAKTAAEAARQKAESERAARQAELERRKAEEERRKAELAKQKEETCKAEETRFKELIARGSEGKELDNVKTFAREATCERLKPEVANTLKSFENETSRRLVTAAQVALSRIGCFSGDADGNLGSATRAALGRYHDAKKSPGKGQSDKGRSNGDLAITDDMVKELGQQSGRVCPLKCKAGEAVKDDTCVAETKPQPPAAAQHKRDDKATASKPARRPERTQTSRQREPAPRARQEASRPAPSYRAAPAMIGVGF
ncbi:caspase family protein [Nitrobacter winogradskyi]|uniref:Flagellar biosynthesis GTPase FlhF n=2 Tax=Nitrobacter winogradskyi TaxID=913 RepID=A0ACC6AJQ2_NITWI|nr:caspase family protein [Nitrobacter winogradskyi]MCP1999762.1 flagellar biosynthesis GTPase FlhF [Nitrobacter winogradskyi]